MSVQALTDLELVDYDAASGVIVDDGRLLDAEEEGLGDLVVDGHDDLALVPGEDSQGV